MMRACLMPTESACLRAEKDPVIFGDDRVLAGLLRTQLSYLPVRYFGTNQPDLQPYMRKMVSTWMLEVCEEYGCEDQVFPLAVNYMDRFLSLVSVTRDQLQLLGAVCLFISSKLRQCRALGLQQLVYLTDYSVTEHQIREFELTVLHRLNWDLSAVTGFDFVEQLLERLNLTDKIALIRRHSHTFIALCATEDEFMDVSAAVVAAASVSAAVYGMKLPTAERCVSTMSSCVGVQQSQLVAIMQRIEELVQLEMNSVQSAAAAAATAAVHSDCSTPACDKLSSCDDRSSSQQDTPTDLHDVRF